MQQRRGTAAQWTAANPILAAGEIGFETDTSKFKMGNGSSTWSALTYFANAAELAAIIDSAPEALNTLNELAAAIGDNPNFLTALATNERVDGVVLNGQTQLTQASNFFNDALVAHNLNQLNVHGIANTAALATTAEVATTVTAAAATAKSEAIAAANEAADQKILTAINAIPAVTSETLGLGEVDNTQDAFKPVSAAQASAISTAKTEAITAAGIAADSKISTHDLDTTNIHGIADTTLLVTQTDLSNAITGVTVDQSTLAGTGIDWNSVSEAFDVDNTYITTATQTALDLKAPKADPTFTGTVTGVTKTHVGLANVDNTSDLNKPVSTAQATAIATAKSEAISDATSQVNAIITGAPAALNTLDELAAALGDDANFASTVTNSLAAKAPLASPTFTGTVTVGANGVAFTDGTQTKAGVPSITAFATEISSSATLAEGEADKFVPLTGAVTITLPASGYSVGQSIDFWQSSGTGAAFASTNGVVGTPGLKFRTTNSVATAMKISSGWLVFGDLSA